MTSNIETRTAVILSDLEKIFTDLGFEGTQVITKSAKTPIASLLIPLDVDDLERPRFMTLLIYPSEEFENTVFLQYFSEMPFTVAESHLTALYEFLPYLNHKAIVGYFGLVGGGQKPYFRYVQPLRAEEPVTPGHVADVITLVTATAGLFQDILEDVATGKATPEQGRTRIEAIYSK